MFWLVVFNFAASPHKIVEYKFATVQECMFAAQFLVLEFQQFATCVADAGGI